MHHCLLAQLVFLRENLNWFECWNVTVGVYEEKNVT